MRRDSLDVYYTVTVSWAFWNGGFVLSGCTHTSFLPWEGELWSGLAGKCTRPHARARERTSACLLMQEWAVKDVWLWAFCCFWMDQYWLGFLSLRIFLFLFFLWNNGYKVLDVYQTIFICNSVFVSSLNKYNEELCWDCSWPNLWNNNSYLF